MADKFVTDEDKLFDICLEKGFPPSFIGREEKEVLLLTDVIAQQEILETDYNIQKVNDYLEDKDLGNIIENINTKDKSISFLKEAMDDMFKISPNDLYEELKKNYFPNVRKEDIIFCLANIQVKEDYQPLFLFALNYFNDKKIAKTWDGLQEWSNNYQRSLEEEMDDIQNKKIDRENKRKLLSDFYKQYNNEWKKNIISSYNIYDVKLKDENMSMFGCFDTCQATENIPYLVFNYGPNIYHKVIRDTNMDYDIITSMLPTAERFYRTSPNNISFNIVQDSKELSKKSISRGIWDMDKGKLLLKSPINFNYITKALGMINIEEKFSYANVKIEYKVNKIIDTSLFIAYVSNNPYFSSYFYIDESRRPYCESKLTYIYFNSGEGGRKPRITINTSDKETIVNIIAPNDKVADKCHLFFISLFNSYLLHEEEVKSYYNSFFSLQAEEKVKASGAKIKLSTFFGSRYTRNLCSSGGEPKLIFNKEDLKEFEKPVYDGDNEIKRDINHISEWVDTNVDAYLVCTNPRRPYMTVKYVEETDQEIPCCGANPSNRIRRKEKQAQNTVKTFKILSPGTVGQIPSPFMVGGLKNLLRLGVSKVDPHSFLYLLSIVLKKDTSVLLKVIEKNLILCQQSLWNKKIDKLKAQDFIDPLLYYRAIEEEYNVNIYIFENNNRTGKIDIILPSNPSVYCKPYKDRKCILVLRNKGTQMQIQDIPQCELLTLNEEKLLSSSIGLSCWKYIHDKYAHYYIPYSPRERNYTTKNFFSFIDINAFILANNKAGLKLIGQSLDTYGHSRILHYNEGKSNFSLFTPPGQPYNCPIIEDIYILEYSRAIKLFGTPTSQEVVNGNCSGLWFGSLGFKDIFYVPIEEKDIIANLPNLVNEYTYSSESVIQYEERQKTAAVFRMLLSSCLNLYLRDDNKIEDFLNIFTIKKVIYDFDVFKKRKFINSPNFKNYLIDLSKLVPTFTDGKNIFVQSKELLERLNFFIFNYVPNPTGEEPYMFFTQSSDFSQNSLTFTKDDFDYWNGNRKHLGYRISQGEDWLPTTLYPYIISGQEGHLYLVQNVENFNFYRTLDMGLNYYTTGIIDYSCPVICSKDNIPPYKVFSYDGSALLLLQDEAKKDNNFISILSYNNILRDEKSGRFAFLLPIV